MIPTFRPVVFAHHKRKDGTYNVKINVYFKGKERRLPTTIFCTKEDLTRSCHIKNNDILSLCDIEITKMRKAISDVSFFDLEDKDVDWLVRHIKTKLTAASFHLDFFVFAESHIADKKEGTKKNYTTALNAFAKFLGRHFLDINEISKKMLLDFYEYWNNQPKQWYSIKHGQHMTSKKTSRTGQAATAHIEKLGAIFRAAQRKYNDGDEDLILIPRSPFSNLELPKVVHDGQKPLSFDLMQQIILADVPARCPGQRRALDVLVVSFGLMGANVADLMEARKPADGVWEYERKKTRDKRADRARMHVDIPAVLSPYLSRLGAGTSAYWLPELRAVSKQERKVTTRLNDSLRKWCESKKITPFTFYAVRKTWATLARKVADKSIVDEGLAHTGGHVLTDIYADKPWDVINQANADVLAMFQWER